MNVIIWNCRGAKKWSSSNHLSSLIRCHCPDIVVLLESRAAGLSAEKVCRQVVRDCHHAIIPSVGLSGRIIMLWKMDFGDIGFVPFGQQMLRGVVTPKNKKLPMFVLGCNYASANYIWRREL